MSYQKISQSELDIEKPKIAFVSCGTSTYIGPYLQFFKDRGHDVYWITYDRPERDFGVPTYDISHGASARNTLSKWRYILAGISIRKILKEIEPHILNGYYATIAGVVSLISGFRPYIISVQGSDLIGSMKSAVWKGIFSLNIGILAYSLVNDTLNTDLIAKVLFFFWSFLYLRDYIAVGDYGCELDDESIYYQEQDPSEVYGD